MSLQTAGRNATRTKQVKQSDWRNQTERGNTFFLSVLITVARYLGRNASRLLLIPITFYFVLTGKEAKQASKNYLRRILGKQATFKNIFKHFYYFSTISLDRFFLLVRKHKQFHIITHNNDIIHRLHEQKKGCLLFVSHIGSFDMLRILAIKKQTMPIKILMNKNHNAMAMQLIDKLDPNLSDSIIDANQFMPDLILKIKDNVAQGNMVGIMVDRLREHEASVGCSLLGDKIQLPSMPWLLANLLQVPIVCCFGLYCGKNNYTIYFEATAEKPPVARKQRAKFAAESAQEYCQRMEHYLALQPYNWFNFYDFWKDESTQH